MNKYKSDYFKPYIRRIRQSDITKAKASDIRIRLYLAVADELKFNYVLIHGDCGIIDVGNSKQEIKRKISKTNTNKEFNQWANKVKNLCQEW